MKNATVRQLDSHTWQFTEKLLGEAAYCYLLEGNERSLLIDTAYGFTDIPGTIKKLTDKPLTVVNTHGHFDHISGNYLYNEVYLSEKDREVYLRHSHRDTIEKILQTATDNALAKKCLLVLANKALKRIYSHPFPDTLSLPKCGYFELGDRKVDIIETPGHTAGSISLLDVNSGWLFSGDLIFYHSYGRFDLTGGNLQTLKKSIKEKILTLPPDTIIFPGHEEYTRVRDEEVFY